MPRSLTPRRRVATAVRWPLGVALTFWRYLWRTVPMHRLEEEGDWETDAPPPLPDGVCHAEAQGVQDGAGRLFHRRYRTRIRESRLTPEALIERICADPDCVAPTEFASFIKVKGDPGAMRVGDEYIVRMPGPWDGPVCVVERTPASFRFVTLAGHLEAGQIRFSARREDQLLVFEIESWARSATRVVDVLYDTLRISKETQLHMWTSLLQRAAELSGGRITGGIDIHTRRVSEPGHAGDLGRHDRRVRQKLAALRGRRVNYDPDAPHPESEGWRIDDYCEPLPREAPGPPEEGGSFRVAQKLLLDYQVADPSIVRPHYDHDAALEGRDMLLELRFLGLRVYAGCRVGRIVDEERRENGRPVRVWGWPYQTLEGHIEQGEMSWEVWKWMDTGEVQFRIHSYSRMVGSRNPFIIVGVRLFGQHERRRYLTTACERIARLTAEGLRGRHPAGREVGAA
jgi:uncharacterized protein (UPF0548 family)